jgi:hypothetical protein
MNMGKGFRYLFFGSLLLGFVHSSGAASLQASASLNRSGTSWNYTVENQEPAGSGNGISSFYLRIAGPVSQVAAPPGWVFDTDNQTFILWSNVQSSPYSQDINPAASLSGFQFETPGSEANKAYELSSWDQGADARGPFGSGTVAAPSALYGDLNRDQSVDVLDVTRALRFIIGLDALVEDEVSLGDVRPYPGTAHRAFGDGRLGVDDANWILRRAVGLTTDPRG